MSTKTHERPRVEVDVDLELSPTCGLVDFEYQELNLFGFKIRRGLHDLKNLRKCHRTAVWAGATRCCGQTMLACNPHCKGTTADGRLYCQVCRKNPKPPVWRRI